VKTALALAFASLVASSPALAANPGKNGMIAFVSTGPVVSGVQGRQNIWVMNPDGSNPQALTASGPSDPTNIEPHWSPDGNQIAFSRCPTVSIDCSLGGELYVIDFDGRGERRLSSGYSPSWSPDGKQLLLMDRLTRPDASGVPAAYQIKEDGTGKTAIGKPGCVLSPRWSPKGDRMLYYDPGCSRPAGLYTAKLDASAVASVTPAAFELGALGAWDWSPDASNVLFDWVDPDASEPSFDVFRVDLGSGAVEDLLASGASDANPAWSPDGKPFVYDSGGELWTVDSTGRNAARLTSTSWMESQPSWQPCVAATKSCSTPTPGSSPPPPPPPPLDGLPGVRTAVPAVRVLSRNLVVQGDRTVRVLVRCPRRALGGCRGRVILTARIGSRSLPLGRRRFAVAPGASVIDIRLTPEGARLVAHYGHLRVRVAISARDGLGRASATSAVVVIRPLRTR
jgi:Tol biopolymer transport system component